MFFVYIYIFPIFIINIKMDENDNEQGKDPARITTSDLRNRIDVVAGGHHEEFLEFIRKFPESETAKAYADEIADDNPIDNYPDNWLDIMILWVDEEDYRLFLDEACDWEWNEQGKDPARCGTCRFRGKDGECHNENSALYAKRVELSGYCELHEPVPAKPVRNIITSEELWRAGVMSKICEEGSSDNKFEFITEDELNYSSDAYQSDEEFLVLLDIKQVVFSNADWCIAHHLTDEQAAMLKQFVDSKEPAQYAYFVNRIIEVISNLEEDDEANDFVDLYCISLNNAGEECDEEDRIDTDELRKQVNEIDQRINL